MITQFWISNVTMINMNYVINAMTMNFITMKQTHRFTKFDKHMQFNFSLTFKLKQCNN